MTIETLNATKKHIDELEKIRGAILKKYRLKEALENAIKHVTGETSGDGSEINIYVAGMCDFYHRSENDLYPYSVKKETLVKLLKAEAERHDAAADELMAKFKETSSMAAHLEDKANESDTVAERSQNPGN